MRENSSLVSLTAGGLTAFGLVTAIFLSSSAAVRAGEDAKAKAQQPPTCACPGTSSRPQRPKFVDLKASPDDGLPLDASDRMAALSSVQQALSQNADGATYVWHRNNGRLSGLVKTTTSFKNTEGAICRHLVIMLTTGAKTQKTEGVACRGEHGVWILEG
jgi:surface antigen